MIGNFTIQETTDSVVVHYRKSAKDWFDTALTLAFTLFLVAGTFLLLRQGVKTMSVVVIAAGLLFAFQTFVQGAISLSHLLQPIRNLLVIDKHTGQVVARPHAFSRQRLALTDIKELVVRGQQEQVRFGGKRTTRTFCTISARLTSQATVPLFTLNTNRFLRVSARQLETELYSTARQLTLALNKHLQARYRWAGYSEAR
ncbi:hypothetical protein LJY25_08685 [Hymenobacter sp. BT175]|nr:hypothetical protein [Hymenobacter translucens]